MGEATDAWVEVLARASAVAFLALVATLPWSVAPMSIAVVLCAALTILLCVRPRGARWVRTPVDLPALAWIAALVLASAFALDPARSWPRVTKGFLLLIVPVAALHARNESLARRALSVLLFSGGAAALYALGRFFLQGPHFPNRVQGAVGHPLTYGGQAMILASLGTAIALRSRGRWRLGTLLALAVLLPALAGTYTRSAWLGYVAALGTIVAFTRARWLLALTAGLAILAGLLPGAYRARAFSSFDPGSRWNVERIHMWEAGARMTRDRPWTGVGLQDLHSLYERYKPAGAVEPAGHLHSVYVQVSATMGIVGLIALAILMSGLLRSASRGLRAPPESFAGAVSLGVTAALVGFLVSGLFEWNFGDEELLDLLYVLIGIAFASGSWVRPRAESVQEPLPGGARFR